MNSAIRGRLGIRFIDIGVAKGTDDEAVERLAPKASPAAALPCSHMSSPRFGIPHVRRIKHGRESDDSYRPVDAARGTLNLADAANRSAQS